MEKSIQKKLSSFFWMKCRQSENREPYGYEEGELLDNVKMNETLDKKIPVGHKLEDLAALQINTSTSMTSVRYKMLQNTNSKC